MTVKNKTKNTLWPYTNVKIIYLGNLIFLRFFFYQSKKEICQQRFSNRTFCFTRVNIHMLIFALI